MERHENHSIERPNPPCNSEPNPDGNPNPTPVPNNHPNDYKQVLYITSGIVLIIAILCYVIFSNHTAMKLELEMVKESLKQMTDFANDQLVFNYKLNKLHMSKHIEDKFSLQKCSVQNYYYYNGNCSYEVKYMPYANNIPHGKVVRGNIIASIPTWSSLIKRSSDCVYIHDTSNILNSCILQCSDKRHKFNGVAITLDGKNLLLTVNYEDSAPDTYCHIIVKKINAAENEKKINIPSLATNSQMRGLAIHPIYGHIFVADMTNSRIHVLNSDFSYNYTFGGGKGNTKGKFLNLAFIAVDREGYVYVTDHGRNCVLKFNSKGIFIKEFGSDRLNSPVGIAIDSYGAVYVLDSYNPPKFNTHIYIFDSDGNFIHYIEYIRDGDEVMRIPDTLAIAIDDKDNLIIPDNKRRRFIVI